MFALKLIISNLVIITCVLIGRRFPALGGLVATMPLTSLLVLLWLYSDNPTHPHLLTDYVQGVLWGIGPTVAFFAALLVCLRHGCSVPFAVTISALLWLLGAFAHYLLLQTHHY